MRTWTVSELDNIASSMSPLIGLKLQEVITGPQEVLLGFYSSSGMLWVWVDLNAVRPSLLPWGELPYRPVAQKTPLGLFLKAHFVGRTLAAIDRPVEFGRVIRFIFGKETDRMTIEVRLFPHGRNIIINAGKKKISWQKPKEISSTGEDVASVREMRSLEQLREEWIRNQALVAKGGKSKAHDKVDPRIKLERDLKKKKGALTKVTEEFKRKQDLPWREVGDWLKHNQSLKVPIEWSPFIDSRRKLAWNIEECFRKARDIDSKMLGTEKRLEILAQEIMALEERLQNPNIQSSIERPRPGAPSLAKAKAQGRTLKLSDDLTVVMGKSAADNMKILRKARAWDLWLHMRDNPSSHAIVFRNKGFKVSDGQMFEIAAWFVRTQLGDKAARHIGEKYSIIIAECRNVSPIKGDKLGRVTVRNERNLIFQFKG